MDNLALDVNLMFKFTFDAERLTCNKKGKLGNKYCTYTPQSTSGIINLSLPYTLLLLSCSEMISQRAQLLGKLRDH